MLHCLRMPKSGPVYDWKELAPRSRRSRTVQPPKRVNPRLSIDGLEDSFSAVLEDHPGPVDPVALVDVGEVPKDLVGRPRVELE